MMKNFKFFLTTTTILLILLPFLVKGQEPESFLNCSWSNPVDFNGDTPTTTKDIWNFKNATCSSAVVEKINDENSTSSFFLIKGWDYGQLLIVFLMILFFFLLIFILVFNFFFEPVFKIRGRK